MREAARNVAVCASLPPHTQGTRTRGASTSMLRSRARLAVLRSSRPPVSATTYGALSDPRRDAISDVLANALWRCDYRCGSKTTL